MSESDSPGFRPHATMRDVAALAGVGLKTVSRVINGEARVSPETAERVRRAATQLDYRPDFYAATLKRAGRKTQSIGLIVGNVANPFSGALARGVEDVASDRGSAVLTSSLDDDPGRERRLVEHMVSRRTDALVLTPVARDQGYLVRERERGTALVFVDREAHGIVGDTVVTDNAAAAERATRHLVEHGHRRIAFLGDRPELWTASERLRGFLAAAPEPVVIEHAHSEAGARDAVLDILRHDDPPTAVFAAQNLLSIGAIRGLREAGASHRVALVSFDDVPLGDLLEPGLTVVRQDPYAIGRVAAELAFAQLTSPGRDPEVRVVPSEFIPRGSGEIRPEGAR